MVENCVWFLFAQLTHYQALAFEVEKSISRKTSKLIAIDGMPNNVPSDAADIVPEYNKLCPTFAPAFIPEMIKSGFFFIIAFWIYNL